MRLTHLKTLIIVIVAVGLAIAGLGSIAWTQMRRPEVSAVMRGEKLAQKLGCLGCHGTSPGQKVLNPASRNGYVPSWTFGEAEKYAKTQEDIRDWILHGAPRAQSVSVSDSASASTEPDGLIPMPKYQHKVSEKELDDLVAYFQAVSGWYPDMPDGVYEGWKVANQTGCFGCHGPSGRGGVSNPGSFKGIIPPWDGDDFKELVQDEQELREWILDGKPRRLAANALARHFLDGQTIQMPAYRGYVSNEQLNLLVKYVQWLGGH